MKIEACLAGDGTAIGADATAFWGNVPGDPAATLLEICGPLFHVVPVGVESAVQIERGGCGR